MKVLFACSEIAPWVKTGGLGDVAAALPVALREAGLDVRVLVPAYPAFKAAFPNAPMVAAIPAHSPQMHGAAVRMAQADNGLILYLLECDVFFDRPGNPYQDPMGTAWSDNGYRYGLLSRVAALLASPASPLGWQPEVLHCNDWQTALAPALLHYGSAPKPPAKSVLTIHNLAFQGLFDRALMAPLGLPDSAWAVDGVEFFGALSFLKAGLQHADAITTVSPTYAREIQTDAEGMGMAGLLRFRSHALTGIVNGIDTREWNAKTDRALVANYDETTLNLKPKNTVALRAEMGLAKDFTGPVIGMVCRLTYQKGVDLVLAIAEELAALPVQLAILGSGDKAFEAEFSALAQRYPGQFAVHLGFDEGLAHRIEAGADLFFMPSRFEPCGLNQLYSLRYGTLPIVRSTGGLADTVIDATDEVSGNGFVFDGATPQALLAASHRALATWHDKKAFSTLQRRAMAHDYSWKLPARATIDVYHSLISDHK